jgi:hypothetical protein
VPAKKYTLEELRSWAPEKLRQLYDNAGKHPDGKYIRDLIEQNGLPLSSGGLNFDDPVFRKIVELVWSKQGQALAIEATKHRVPALCGIDRLLREELGDRYGKYDLGTSSAGYVVAEMMRHLGYREAGHGKCPTGCTAKTGLLWR